MGQSETPARLTSGLVAGHRDDALLFDVQLQLRVAAAHVLAAVAEAQHHAVAQPPAAGHRALGRGQEKPVTFPLARGPTQAPRLVPRRRRRRRHCLRRRFSTGGPREFLKRAVRDSFRQGPRALCPQTVREKNDNSPHRDSHRRERPVLNHKHTGRTVGLHLIGQVTQQGCIRWAHAWYQKAL